MTDLCRNCCKMSCENRNRNDLLMCDSKMTYVQAGIIDKPKVIEPIKVHHRIEGVFYDK